MIHVIFPGEIEEFEISGVNVFLILDIGMKVKRTILMLFLTYYPFMDSAFSS